MLQGKMLIALVTLVVGFLAGFVLRPVMTPTVVATAPAPLAVAAEAPRSVQFFAAHLDDARRIVAGCRDGSVRGDECANADQAIVHAEGREHAAKFLGQHP